MPWILALGGLDLGLEQFMVVPILPAVQVEFAASLDSTSWLLTGFLLAAVATVPLVGRLGDLRGRRRMLLVALSFFAAGSLVCALAGSIEALIAGRVAQGFGAGLGPLALGLAREHARPERVAVWVGFLVAGAGAGAALGLLLGGVLVDHGGIAAVFWFLFALAAVLLLSVWRFVPESRSREPARVDWPGSALLAAGLLAALLAVSEGNDWGWTSARVVALFVCSGLLLAGFLVVERASPAPILDMRLLRKRPVWSAVVVAFSLGFVLLIAAVAIPQLAAVPQLEGGFSLSAAQTGFALVPGAVAILVGGWVSGALVGGTGARWLAAAGGLLAVLAYAILALGDDSLTAVIAGNAVLGLGVGVGFTAVVNLMVHAVGTGRTAAFAATTAVSRMAGGALGAQVAAAIVIAAGLTSEGFPDASGFTGVFVLGLIAAVCAVAASVLMPGRSADPTVAAVAPRSGSVIPG